MPPATTIRVDLMPGDPPPVITVGPRTSHGTITLTLDLPGAAIELVCYDGDGLVEMLAEAHDQAAARVAGLPA